MCAVSAGLLVRRGLSELARNHYASRIFAASAVAAWSVAAFAWVGPPLLPTDAPQAQQLKSMSLEQLGNVRVTTVSKQPEEVWHTPAAIYVLTHEEILQSGARTIPDLLRLIPGVQVAQEQSDQWAVGIRGFASPFSKGLLVLIDGRSVYTPLFEGVYWDVQDLALDNIQRIEVIRGPGGTIWGPNAVNGVINIITRSAGATQGGKVEAYGGSKVERFDGMARYGFRPAPNVRARIWAKGFDRGPELNPGGDPYDDWHQERGGFRADWEPNTDNHFMLSGMMYGGESGEMTRFGTLTPPSNVALDADQVVAGGDVVARWDHDLAGGSDFYVQAYFDRTHRNTPQFAEGRNTFDVDAIVHLANLPRQNVVLGAGLRESPSSFEQKQATVNMSPHKQNDSLYSLFAQDEVQIVPDRLMLTLGSKFEENNFSGWGAEPSARLMWNPRKTMSLWGAVTRALRIPGRLDTDTDEMLLLRQQPVVFEALRGNPDFKPEVMIGWEAGYRQLLHPRLYIDVAAYHNDYDNLESYNGMGPVVTHPTSPYTYTLYTYSYANGLRGVTDGIEVSPDWKVVQWWELRGSYTHVHMRLHSKPGFSQDAYAASETGFVPDHEASVESIFTLPHGVHLTADYRHMSALPANNIPAYDTGDGLLGWQISKHWELSVTGRNLLQPSHQEGIGDLGNVVGIRRTVFAGLQWSH